MIFGRRLHVSAEFYVQSFCPSLLLDLSVCRLLWFSILFPTFFKGLQNYNFFVQEMQIRTIIQFYEIIVFTRLSTVGVISLRRLGIYLEFREDQYWVLENSRESNFWRLKRQRKLNFYIFPHFEMMISNRRNHLIFV